MCKFLGEYKMKVFRELQVCILSGAHSRGTGIDLEWQAEELGLYSECGGSVESLEQKREAI